MKDLLVRKKNRLKNYNYSRNGVYFITFCVKDRHELLGSIDVGAAIGRPSETRLSEYGVIVDTAIQKIDEKYESVKVDQYIVMPNHIHMILITDGGRAMRAPTISTVINQLKGYVSKQIGFSMWQKSFHDHIIRDEKDYHDHCRYIDENPAKWEEDDYYGEKQILV